MTLTPAELELSPEATARLDDYLRQVRAALTGAADVNPDEIDADVREHVENELHAAPRPVPLPALEAVLTKLGPPSQWGTTSDPTLFARARRLLGEQAKRVRFTLLNGPEDWRLAYLSFGIFALGILTFFFLFPVTLLVSYILSRAGLALAKEKGITLGAGRKWLLYPPVVLVSVALLLSVAVWPVAAGVATAQEVAGAANRVENADRSDRISLLLPGAVLLSDRQKKERWAAQVEEDRKLLAAIPVAPSFAPAAAGLFVGFGAVVVWWTILGFVSARSPNAVRATFCPLCDGFKRQHALWLAVPCLALSAAWCATAVEIARAAGWM